MRIGDTLRAYRHHQEMSVSEVAASIGIRPNTLREIETGAEPRARTLLIIFQWLCEDKARITCEYLTDHNRDA